MTTLKQLKPKLAFIKKSVHPILAMVKVNSGSIECTDLETSVKIKDTFGMSKGLQSIVTLGIVESTDNNVDDYPLIKFGQNTLLGFNIDAASLEDLNQYASKDETRPYLCGVAIDGNHLVATNGYILKSLKMAISNDDSYIMPSTSIKILIGLAKLYKVGTLHIRCNEDYAVVDNEYFTLTMRLIKIEYPRWYAIIPAKFINKLQVTDWIDYKELKPLFKDDKSNKCTIKSVEGNIVLIPANYKSELFIIGETDLEFEIGFTIELLNIAIGKSKSFTLEFNNELAPCGINGAIVMPLKL